MSPNQLETITPLVAGVTRHRRLRAFAVLVAVIFMGCCLLFHNATETNRTTTTKTQINLTSPIAESRLNEIKNEFCNLQLGDSELTQALAAVSTQTELQNPTLIKGDLDSIRKSIKIELSALRRETFVLSTSMDGMGTPDEASLVYMIASRLGNRLSTVREQGHQQPGSVPGSALDDAIVISSLHSQLIEQADRELRTVSMGLDHLKNQSRHSATIQGTTGNAYASQTRSHLEPGSASRMENANLLASLETDLDQLISERETLTHQTTNSDPRLVELNRQIQETRLKIVFLRDPWTGSWLDGESSYLQKAAFEDDHPFDYVSGESARISVEPAIETIAQLQQGLQQQHELLLVAARESGEPGNAHGVSINSIEPAKISAVVPGTKNRKVWLFGFVSIGLGAFIAMRYKPLAKDTGFMNIEDVASTLGIPVTTTIEPGDSPVKKQTAPWANFVVETAEYLFLAFAVIVLTSLIFSPQIRGSFLQSPLEGLYHIARTIAG